MAELTVRIKPDDIVERVVDEVAYKGKTIREWADLLTNPNTNADRIRAMSDEELANELGFVAQDAFMYGCGERERMMLYPFENYKSTLDWLQSPVGGDGDD